MMTCTTIGTPDAKKKQGKKERKNLNINIIIKQNKTRENMYSYKII